jgi:hypothetical protein
MSAFGVESGRSRVHAEKLRRPNGGRLAFRRPSGGTTGAFAAYARAFSPIFDRSVLVIEHPKADQPRFEQE